MTRSLDILLTVCDRTPIRAKTTAHAAMRAFGQALSLDTNETALAARSALYS